MTKWEYCKRIYNETEMVSGLNDMGSDGWEAFSINELEPLQTHAQKTIFAAPIVRFDVMFKRQKSVVL